MKFSIITVCLNSGDALKYTMDSIKAQTYQDYEVYVKDGGSKDDSLSHVPGDIRFKIQVGDDKGIYDAMNMSVDAITGDYIIFMNAGDKFYENDTLEKVAEFIKTKGDNPEGIFYGDTASRLAATVVKAPKEINPKVCYNNIPCHQAMFYSAALLKDRKFDISYRIRADYEHFLYCYFEKKTNFYYMDLTVCEYEGGGFSETKKNRRLNEKEHRLVVAKYIPLKTRFFCRLRLILTLQKLRAAMARSKTFGPAYEKMKRTFK